MLIDSQGRQYTYLRISVTDRCNLLCRYCMPPEGIVRVPRDRILRPEEIGRIAKIFVDSGIQKIRLTGGEPLIRHGLDSILSELNSLRQKPKLAITTNGLLLKDWIPRLVRWGVHGVNVSLDTLKPERFALITGVDAWQRVWEGLTAAIDEDGIEKVKLNVVIQGGINDDEIEAFAGLTLDHPIDVRFIETMPVRQIQWRSNEFVSADEIISRLPGLEPCQDSISKTSGPARYFRFKGAPGRIGFISSISQPVCEQCNRLRLTAQGMLLRCLFESEGLDLREAIRSGQSDGKILKQIC